MDAKRSNVGTGFAGDPEDGEVAVVVELDKLALVDGSHAELALDGRDEGRSLEESSGESLEASCEGLLGWESGVEADNADVFLSCKGGRAIQPFTTFLLCFLFLGGEQYNRKESRLTGTLLRLDEAGRAVDADGQAASDLGVERSRVTSLLDAENTTDPSDDFVR